MKNFDFVTDEMAKIGYETMYKDEWDDLKDDQIEKIMWKAVAVNMISKMWELYERFKVGNE